MNSLAWGTWTGHLGIAVGGRGFAPLPFTFMDGNDELRELLKTAGEWGDAAIRGSPAVGV
jgi:hypothetical protein